MPGSCCGSSSCCESGPDYTIFSDSYGTREGYNSDADLNLGCVREQAGELTIFVLYSISCSFSKIRKLKILADRGTRKCAEIIGSLCEY